MMIAVKTGDLYLSSGRGGGGLGDPLLRSDEAIEEDIAGGHIQRRLGRARLRRARTATALLHAAPRARARRRASGGPSSASGSSPRT